MRILLITTSFTDTPGKYQEKLKLVLKTENIPHTNQFYFFGYNPPYEIFNRKNEVIVELY